MVTFGRTILVDVIIHLRTRLAEWVFAAILAVFACRLLLPGNTFDTSPGYSYMAHWLDEKSWGEIIGAVAALRLAALTINGTVRVFRIWTPYARAVTAWLSAGVWCCLAFGFWHSNSMGTAWGTYGVIFIADVCLSFAIARDAGHACRMSHRARAARGR